MAKMTTMHRWRTRKGPQSQASRAPRRAEQAREAMVKVNAARTQALGLVSALQTRAATSKMNSRKILRKRSSCRGSWEPVALVRSSHNLCRPPTRRQSKRTETHSHAILHLEQRQRVSLERTPHARIRRLTPSPTQAASSQ